MDDVNTISGDDADPMAAHRASSLNASEPTPRERIKLNPENVDQGLAQLVLTIIQLLRQLMERQALQRMEKGELTDAQIEQMGETFRMLDIRMHELLDHFNLKEEDLNINLGPLGDLM